MPFAGLKKIKFRRAAKGLPDGTAVLITDINCFTIFAGKNCN
jgi:hypothetical protein